MLSSSRRKAIMRNGLRTIKKFSDNFLRISYEFASIPDCLIVFSFSSWTSHHKSLTPSRTSLFKVGWRERDRDANQETKAKSPMHRTWMQVASTQQGTLLCMLLRSPQAHRRERDDGRASHQAEVDASVSQGTPFKKCPVEGLH